LALGVVTRALVGGLGAAGDQAGGQGEDRARGLQPRGEGRGRERSV
jgi:hypothetical protein